MGVHNQSVCLSQQRATDSDSTRTRLNLSRDLEINSC